MPDDVLPPPAWVDTPAGLAALAADLAGRAIVAVDTESNSLHAYREQVCLIQFSTPEQDYLLDPLAVKDLSALAPILEDPAVVKVFHAAEYDLVCLQRDFGWRVRSLFDTMVAVRTLGWPQQGLAAVLESQFGVKLNKRHQRADWAARPLTLDQLAYARMDTRFLIPLREKLIAELETAGCLVEAYEEFERLCQVNGRAAQTTFDPQNFWHISGARDLTPRQAAVLRELYIYREQIAERLNRPPFKVLAEGTLVEITLAEPRVLADLKPITGMTERQIGRHGHQLLQAVARGQKAPPQRPRRPVHESDEVLERYERLRRWRRERAQKRGVESDVIVPRDTLWELARRPPHTQADLEQLAGLGPVRRAKYGEDLLRLLNPPPADRESEPAPDLGPDSPPA
jgi:ribonuclease D